MESKTKIRVWTEKWNAVADYLLADEYADWSRPAAYAITELWMDHERNWDDLDFILGNALPDRVAWRCEFYEYESPAEALEDRGLGPEHELELMAGEHGEVLRLENGGILLAP